MVDASRKLDIRTAKLSSLQYIDWNLFIIQHEHKNASKKTANLFT